MSIYQLVSVWIKHSFPWKLEEIRAFRHKKFLIEMILELLVLQCCLLSMVCLKSMVAPLLFIMCINDIVGRSCVTNFVTFNEISVFISDNNLCHLAERTGNLLSDVKTWLRVIHFTFHECKSKFMIFHRKQRHYPTFPALT